MSNDPLSTIFTIGCSTHSQDSFISLLRHHEITVIVDVRSVPYSRHTAHFNREVLQKYLALNKISYLFMGAEFGARREEPQTYTQNQVDFEKVFELSIFGKGIQRLKTGLAKGHKIALMCTEKDPIDCHRSIMVTRYISEKLQLPVAHIHFDGSIETNRLFEQRLKELTGEKMDLFTQDEHTLLRRAYRKVESRIAYKGEPVCPI